MARPTDQSPDTADPNRRPLIMMLVAGFISTLGNQITGFAVLWFVLETTGSAARAGLVGFFYLLPIVLALFFGGVLVDRFGRRRMSVIADLASAGTVVLIPILHLTTGLPLAVLFALVFLGSLLDTPGVTARRAMLPELAQRAGLPIERATGLFSSSSAVVELLGPVIAGLLVAAIGATTALFIDAATFIVSAAIIARAVPAMPAVIERSGRYLDEVRDGLRFLFGFRLLITIMLAAAVTNFFAAPIGGVLMPVYSFDNGWSSRDLGFFFAGFGAGMLLGSVAFGVIGHRFQRRLMLIVFFAAAGVPIMLFSVTGSLPSSIVLAALTGLPIGAVGPLIGAVMLERIPEELRGRVLGATGAVSMCAAPLGMLVAGPVVEAIGVSAAFVIYGGVFVLIAGWFTTQPVLREMERLDPGSPGPD